MNRVELEQKWQLTIQNLNIEGLQLMEKFMGGIIDMEEYNINTTEERKAEIVAEQKRREAERKEREAREKAERAKNEVFRYARNDTMKLLGNQYAGRLLSKGGVAYEQFNEIGKACPYESTFDAAMDYFMLGHIWGIRTERARRKGKPLF